jgi:hypothetical protein
MTGRIFINYRRGDDPGYTGRLFDRLQDVFESDQLFLDIDNIAPGLDFVRVLSERISECDIVLAVIGKNWIDARYPDGARRLDDPDDFVRVEIASALSQNKRVIPVLVGDASMPRPEELPEVLRPLSRRNAVRLTHERFRSDAQGLIKALQLGLGEIEVQRKAEAEANRHAQAEEERKQREVEAVRRAEEEERRIILEAEAKQHALAERRQREAEARQRADEEQAFVAAKRAGTALALDAFLTVHGGSGFANEVQMLKATLLAREEAYRRARASDDTAVLESFVATYTKGADVDQIRARLRRQRPRRRLRLRAAAILATSLVAVLLSSAAFYWLEIKSAPSPPRQALAAPNIPAAPTVGSPKGMAPGLDVKFAATSLGPTPDQAAWELLRDTTDVAALKHFIAEYSKSPLREDAEARVSTLEAAKAAEPVVPTPDEVAWQVLKDTTDEAALKHFVSDYPKSPMRKDAEARIVALEPAHAIKPLPLRPDEVAWSFLKDTTDENALRGFVAQYPDSPLRNDAEARIAALGAAHAAIPAPPSSEEIAWKLVKDSTEAGQFRRFVEQFPASKMRAQAEQRIAALTAATAKTTPVDTRDTHALALSLQSELKRVGCFNGAVNGEFNDATRAAEHAFVKLTSINLPDALSFEAIKAVRKFDKRVCPVVCPSGERAEGDRCIAAAPRKPHQRKAERTTAEPQKKASPQQPREQATRQRAAAVEPSAPKDQSGAHLHWLGPRYIVGKDGTVCRKGLRSATNKCQ